MGEVYRARDGALELDEVLAIARAVATGLAVAHEQGVVHRDIKPANVFLGAISGRMSVLTEPPGALVSYRPYGGADSAWRALGQSPVEEARLPRGPFRWRVEKEGYRTVEVARRVVDPAVAQRQRQNAASPTRLSRQSTRST